MINWCNNCVLPDTRPNLEILKDGMCNACKFGYYGYICDKQCSENCVDQICEQADGKCSNGCNDGFHGVHCHLTCPQNCEDLRCIQGTGECESCIDGWYDISVTYPVEIVRINMQQGYWLL